jgi:hypothetical protein
MAKPQKQKHSVNKSIFAKATDQVIGAAKKRYTGKNSIKNIVSDISMLKSLLNVEDKHNDALSTLQTISNTTGFVAGVSSLAQGTTVSTRTGDSVKINKIDFLLNFQFSSGTAATNAYADNIYRYFIIRYLKTPTSGGANAFAIAEFLNADAFGNYSLLSLPNTDTNENFQIMSQGTVQVQLPYVPAANSVNSRLVELSIPCGFHQTYNGSATTNVCDNMVFIVLVSLNPVNTGGVSGCSINSRTWFIDN